MRVPLSLYETKSARKKLINAYSDASPLVAAFYESEPLEILLVNDAGKAIYFNSRLIPEKATRTAAGVNLFTMKPGQKIVDATIAPEAYYGGFEKCKKLKLPATGNSVTKKSDT